MVVCYIVLIQKLISNIYSKQESIGQFGDNSIKSSEIQEVNLLELEQLENIRINDQKQQEQYLAEIDKLKNEVRGI